MVYLVGVQSNRPQFGATLMEIVFYDLETTIPADHIIEFGCVAVDSEMFAEVESF